MNCIDGSYARWRGCLVFSWLTITLVTQALPAEPPNGDVPLNLMKELAQMQSTNAVFDRFGDSYLNPFGAEEPQAQAVTIFVGRDGQTRSQPKNNQRMETFSLMAAPAVVPLAENAGCAPTESVIEMPKTNSSVVIYPLGTKVKRCSGICGHSNLLCRPTKTIQFVRKGLVLVYKDGLLKPVGHQDFTLEDHVECSCDCLQKANDCHPNQRYESNNCKCVCRNQADMQSCAPHRVWDYKECRCKCPNICRTCPFGMYFDESYNCACVSPQSLQQRGKQTSRRV